MGYACDYALQSPPQVSTKVPTLNRLFAASHDQQEQIEKLGFGYTWKYMEMKRQVRLQEPRKLGKGSGGRGQVWKQREETATAHKIFDEGSSLTRH